MTSALVEGLLAGYGIALPVGAVGTYLVALTARTSLRVGAAAALGIATTDGLYALVAVLGGTALVGVLAPVAVQLQWVSAGVLVAVALGLAAVGLRGYRHPAGPEDDPAAHAHHDMEHPAAMGSLRAYAVFVAITAVNPTTVVYFTALVIGAQAGQAVSAAQQAVFVAAVLVASASWQLVLAAGGAVLGGLLTGRRGRLVTSLVSAAIIGVLAVRLLPS